MFGSFFSKIIGEYKQSKINDLFKNIEDKSTSECKQILALYLDSGGDINVRNISGIPLLNHLIYNKLFRTDEVEIVRFLVNRGADFNIKSDDTLTPLMTAVEDNQINVVKYLIEMNAELECKDEYGFTALAYSIGNLNYDMVKLLLENQADVNIKLQDCRYKYIDIYENTSLKVFANQIYRDIQDNSSKIADFINERNEKMRQSYLPIIDLISKYEVLNNK